jgi:hypothetical protein
MVMPLSLVLRPAFSWYSDDDDVQACFGQQLRGDAGASARADDGHIAGDAFRQGAVFAAENFPAALQARRNGVNDVGHAISVDAG